MTTFTFSGLTLTYADDDHEIVTGVRNTELLILASSADVAVGYSVLEVLPDGPAVVDGEIISGQIFSATFKDTGYSALAAEFGVVVTVAWGQGKFSTVVSIDNSANGQEQETLIVVGGDPFPEINTPQEWELHSSNAVLSYPQSGPLAPGQTIPLASLLGATITDGDQIAGSVLSDDLDGGEGDDVIEGKAGDDKIDGGEGDDTAVFSGAQSSYSVSLSVDRIAITDRRAEGGDGTDEVKNTEFLDWASEIPAFEGQPMVLNDYDGVASLDADDFTQIVELYIAYFNRAPDAVGLAFWGNAFADGLSIEDMAALFIDQNETRATYPASMSNAQVATAVYNNVLGRIPDAEGFDFWVGVLNSAAVSRDTFILSVLEGAKADPPTGASVEFINQQMTDRQYLSDKTDVGGFFAVHKGMSDVADATAVMSIFDGTPASVQAAVSATEEDFTEALDGTNGDFLMPIVGVIDNPFEAF